MIAAKMFDFQEQLKMSEGASRGEKVEGILLKNFPTAEKVERANSSDDRNGTDFWVTMQSGNRVSVDLKARAKDRLQSHNEDDVALELWSVIGKKIGWTLDKNKRTDYILFLWKDTGRWMLVPFPCLLHIFTEYHEEWSKTFDAPIQPNKTWKSQCVFVPRKLLWAKIYGVFGGNPA